ncbi:MAG TPA: 16S rRNA (guanine(966)-N(2))-methyltransferase RsmD [Alphaproteobacteria bacterium]|jgi:16S rRNA (guanine966-N2)-methyltransferase
MRIVGGRHRGRRIEAPPGEAIRPTSDRAREAIFNILAHGGFGAGGASPIAGAMVLDVFCGTGAMGLEALSRGAARAAFIDNEPQSLVAARANIAALREQSAARVMAADATRPPPRPKDIPPATLAFFDPPYAENVAAAALAGFAAGGWLAPGALCVVEEAARAPALAPPPGFAALETRRYGAARVTILRYSSDPGSLAT